MAGMTDKELEQVQHELENQLTAEQETDMMIVSAAEEIAAALTIHKGKACPYTINDTEYLFRYYVDNGDIVVLIVNRSRYELSNGKLGLQTARAEIEDGMSEKQGLVAAVEGYIRHITGNIKPEMIDDE